MLKKVFGIACESKGSGKESEHTHDLYLVSWDGRALHAHHFTGVTSYDVGHQHHYVGTTEPAPSGVPHTHTYRTYTSFDDGHRHLIVGRTGPAIPLPNGGHIHFFHGYTSVDGRTPHSHYYSGYTSP